MKNYVLRSIAVLIMFAAFLSCSSDSDSSTPCTPVTCLNGGTSTTNCGCNCSPGYSGNNCSTRITPTKITITKVRVTMFPNMNGVNYWDAGVGLPDISVLMGRLASPSPTVIWSATEYYPNVTSTGSNFFDFVPATPIQITQVTIPHVVELIDYDGADTLPSPDDSMGVIAFYPYVSANGFPTIIIVNDNSIPLRFELTVSYQW